MCASGSGLLDLDPHEHERREQAHEDLIAAFRKRDPDLAAQAIYDHLARNEEAARKALDAYRTGCDEWAGGSKGQLAKNGSRAVLPSSSRTSAR